MDQRGPEGEERASAPPPQTVSARLASFAQSHEHLGCPLGAGGLACSAVRSTTVMPARLSFRTASSLLLSSGAASITRLRASALPPCSSQIFRSSSICQQRLENSAIRDKVATKYWARTVAESKGLMKGDHGGPRRERGGRLGLK